MKINKNIIKKMILNEIRLINESKATDAESAIKKAVMSVELKGSGATMSQKGIANLIGKFSNYLLKEEITNKDVSDMKNYLESVNKSYFSKK